MFSIAFQLPLLLPLLLWSLRSRDSYKRFYAQIFQSALRTPIEGHANLCTSAIEGTNPKESIAAIGNAMRYVVVK
jgi:hypothetical protein